MTDRNANDNNEKDQVTAEQLAAEARAANMPEDEAMAAIRGAIEKRDENPAGTTEG